MINKERLVSEFIRLTAFDSESYHEKEIKEYLKGLLTGLGADVTEDEADELLGVRSKNSAGNLYACFPPSEGEDGDYTLFCSHMDTVSPGKGKKARVHEDGTITSAGDTVLGADDLSGVSEIIEALRVIKERGLKHRGIEIVLSVAEEPYCRGISVFDHGRLKAKRGYVLDLNGKVGKAAIAAPTILDVEVNIKGKSAHAGFEPEKGINALSAAAAALSVIPAGRTGEGHEAVTVNFGTVNGGTVKNAVPENICIGGEIRSLSHGEAVKAAENIRKVFEDKAADLGAFAEVSIKKRLKAYEVKEDSPVVERFRAAAKKAGITETSLNVTYGGSDANAINENGVPAIVLACAMEDVHTTRESTTVCELVRSAELVLALMTACG